MQIKERGSKTVFLRFEYNPTKKRTENRSVGTQDKYLDTLSDAVASNMTEAERVEAQEWLDERKRLNDKRMSKYNITSLPREMALAVNSINDPEVIDELGKADFDAIYHAWSDLAEAMRGAGFKRPVARKKES